MALYQCLMIDWLIVFPQGVIQKYVDDMFNTILSVESAP